MQFRQTVVNTVANVKGYYYDLIYAIDNLEAARKSLDLAKKLLDENEIRVKVGTMAPLDVVSAQSEVASREEDVIVAENDLADAEDTLKQAIFAENDPAMWALRILPTDRPDRRALPGGRRGGRPQRPREAHRHRGRPQGPRARRHHRAAAPRTRCCPSSTSWRATAATGVGGTQLIRDRRSADPSSTPIPGGYGDALSERLRLRLPHLDDRRQRLLLHPQPPGQGVGRARPGSPSDQALASFRRLELQVAAEVRTAARGVETNFKRVASTRAARVLAEQRLDAEEKKFAAGMSTNFFVTQAQRDLALAEVERARAPSSTTARASINFERVQEAGVSGSGAVAVLSGGASSAQASQAMRSSAAAARPSPARARSSFVSAGREGGHAGPPSFAWPRLHGLYTARSPRRIRPRELV